MKKNIALIVDIKLDSGGALGMVLSKIDLLKKSKDIKLSIITTYKSLSNYLLKKYKIDNIFFDKNYIPVRFTNYLNNLGLLKYSSFENFLINRKVDEVFFLSPSYLNMYFNNINYIYTVFDLSHLEKKLQSLPEHDKHTIFLRNKSYFHAAKNAKKIIVGTLENKKKFCNYYNATKNKVDIIRFPPKLCTIKSNISNINNLDITKKFFLLYPAQYWKHKNHKYIIDSFIQFKKKKFLKDFFLICSGHDKGELEKLKKIVKKNNLENKIKFLNYISDEELIYLYKNCFGLVFPSYIGSHSFPLYEGFYFNKPVFYNSSIISEELKKFVYLIDIKKKKSLLEKINVAIKFKEKNKQLIKRSKKLYKKEFNEINLNKKLLNLFK